MVIEKTRALDFDVGQLASWATGLVQAFGLKKDEEKRSLDGLSLDYLSYIGLSSLPIARPKAIFDEEVNMVGQPRKMPALTFLRKEAKRAMIVDDIEMS